ncbi:MAG: BatD family protein [Pseudomonadota bacterium]
MVMQRLPLFILGALLAPGAAHAATLAAQLDRTTSALGEPVTLTVEAKRIDAAGFDLGALDLAPLVERFDVQGRTLNQGSDSATLVLTLYPRAAGSVRIPPLHVGAIQTAALTLRVTDGSSDVPRVRANWSLDPATPAVNQPARLTLDVCDTGSLQWQRPALSTHAGRVVRALGEEEGRAELDGEACTLHRFHWALLPTRAGEDGIRVPMLDASRFGARLRFPGASLHYRAQPLPAWLPPHVPPVEPRVEADAWPARWPLDRPLARRFVVTGGYSADGLKALLDLQLRESPQLAVYPPLIEAQAPEDRNSPLARHAVTLFLQPRATGEHALPALRLPWFDPVSGELGERTLPGGQLSVFDPRRQRAGEAGAALTAAGLLAALGWLARRMLTWRLARRRGLVAIRAAYDADTLAHAVRAFSLAGAAPAPSLGAWQRQLQQETGADASFAVAQLERHCFGCDVRTLPELREAFLRMLAAVRPRRTWRRQD